MDKNKKIILSVIVAIIAIFAVGYGVYAIMDHFDIFGKSSDKVNTELREENAAGKFFRGKYFSYVTNTNDLNEATLKAWINDYLQEEVNKKYGTNYTVSSVWETSKYIVIVVKDFAFFIVSKDTGEVRFVDYNEEMKRSQKIEADYNNTLNKIRNFSDTIDYPDYNWNGSVGG